jgi:hypothetical protein
MKQTLNKKLLFFLVVALPISQVCAVSAVKTQEGRIARYKNALAAKALRFKKAILAAWQKKPVKAVVGVGAVAAVATAGLIAYRMRQGKVVNPNDNGPIMPSNMGNVKAPAELKIAYREYGKVAVEKESLCKGMSKELARQMQDVLGELEKGRYLMKNLENSHMTSKESGHVEYRVDDTGKLLDYIYYREGRLGTGKEIHDALIAFLEPLKKIESTYQKRGQFLANMTALSGEMPEPLYRQLKNVLKELEMGKYLVNTGMTSEESGMVDYRVDDTGKLLDYIEDREGRLGTGKEIHDALIAFLEPLKIKKA